MKKIKGFLFTLLLSLGLAISVKAAPVPIITSFTWDVGAWSAGYSLGYRFTAEDDLFVTALGFVNYTSPDLLNGNYQVGIWDETGTLLDSVTVMRYSPNVYPFRYADLDSPLLLTAGSDYYLATTVRGDDFIPVQSTTINTDPRISYVDSYYEETTTELLLPTHLSPEGNDYMVVNALIDVVPIPGGVWLLGFGLVGLVGLRKKFKN